MAGSNTEVEAQGNSEGSQSASPLLSASLPLVFWCFPGPQELGVKMELGSIYDHIALPTVEGILAFSNWYSLFARNVASENIPLNFTCWSDVERIPLWRHEAPSTSLAHTRCSGNFHCLSVPALPLVVSRLAGFDLIPCEYCICLEASFFSSCELPAAWLVFTSIWGFKFSQIKLIVGNYVACKKMQQKVTAEILSVHLSCARSCENEEPKCLPASEIHTQRKKNKTACGLSMVIFNFREVVTCIWLM